VSGEIRIGISGWTYEGWRGKFYPPDLAQAGELQFASRAFNSIEINGTHYALQKPETFRKWYESTPKGFVFSVKGSRYITHLKRLSDVEDGVARFFASGVLELREKLGPFLWQFPPTFRYDAERMEHFFKLLPQNTSELARQARQHSPGLRRLGKEMEIRHCVEIRHESFLQPEFIEMLRHFGIAFVIADSGGRWPYAEDLTGDFAYLRLHGAKELYASGYGDGALDHWAKRIRLWAQGKQPADAQLCGPKPKPRAHDVFIYFDNDAKVMAPGDARRLAGKLHVQPAAA